MVLCKINQQIQEQLLPVCYLSLEWTPHTFLLSLSLVVKLYAALCLLFLLPVVLVCCMICLESEQNKFSVLV